MYAQLAHLYDNAARDVFSAQANQITCAAIDAMLLARTPSLKSELPLSSKHRVELLGCDLACGTGLLSWLVAGLGPRVVGVDVAEGMLEIAKERVAPLSVPSRSTPPRFVLADITTYSPPEPFDFALCFGDVVNHFDDFASLEKMIATTADALAPKGRLILDATARSTFESVLWNSETNEIHDDGTRLTTHVTYDAKSEKAVMTFSSWTKDAAPSAPPSHVETVEERFYSNDRLTSAIENAGMKVVSSEPWKPFDVIDASLPLTKTVFVAEKNE